MAPRTRRTLKQDLRARAQSSRVSTGGSFSNSSGIAGGKSISTSTSVSNNAMKSDGGAAISESQEMTLKSDAKSQILEMQVTSNEKTIVHHSQHQQRQRQPDQTNEKDPVCAPDCKCLLRGRGFFLPANLEEEAACSGTDSRS